MQNAPGLCNKVLLGAAGRGHTHANSGESVVAVTALPPALGGAHSLHIMLPALQHSALCGRAACLALESSHCQPGTQAGHPSHNVHADI